MDEKEEFEQSTQISLHSIRNLLGSRQQFSLFSEYKVKEFTETYGISVEREFSRFGVDLNDMQQKMTEAILHGFTKTNYQGNLDPLEKLDLAKEKFPYGNLPNSYKYLRQLPRLRATQSQILKWASINPKSAGDIQDALKALKHLGTTQYCFYYTRLAFDEEGVPKKDREGEWQKEEVIAVDTLFTIKEVRNKKMEVLEYYEITPSPIFLDQRESFFLLIPFNWREEVKGLIGQRKASSYTFRFLLFLRFQFEMQRRASKERKNYIIKWTSEEIAINLKMPESVYKRKKDRANKILNEIYSVAKSLGYLKDYQRTESGDIFHLNEEKYSVNCQEEKLLPINNEQEESSPEKNQAKELLALLIQERKRIDPKYNPIAGGQVREQSLQNLMALLKTRTFEEIKSVILWGVNKSYWCNRIGAPVKLRKHFNEAYIEMKAAEDKEQIRNPEKYIEANKQFSIAIAKEIEQQSGQSSGVEALSKYIEIGSGSHSPICIGYSENGFMEQVENALRKRGIPIPSIANSIN